MEAWAVKRRIISHTCWMTGRSNKRAQHKSSYLPFKCAVVQFYLRSETHEGKSKHCRQKQNLCHVRLKKTSGSGKTNLVAVSEQLFHSLLQCWCLPRRLSGFPRWWFERAPREWEKRKEHGSGGEWVKEVSLQRWNRPYIRAPIKGTFLIFVWKEQEHFVKQKVYEKKNDKIWSEDVSRS